MGTTRWLTDDGHFRVLTTILETSLCTGAAPACEFTPRARRIADRAVHDGLVTRNIHATCPNPQCCCTKTVSSNPAATQPGGVSTNPPCTHWTPLETAFPDRPLTAIPSSELSRHDRVTAVEFVVDDYPTPVQSLVPDDVYGLPIHFVRTSRPATARQYVLDTPQPSVALSPLFRFDSDFIITSNPTTVCLDWAELPTLATSAEPLAGQLQRALQVRGDLPSLPVPLDQSRRPKA